MIVERSESGFGGWAPPGYRAPIVEEGRLQGIWAPTVTPVLADGTVDMTRLHEHVTWLLEHGCHGVLLFGSTGEASSFTLPERMQVLETLLSEGTDPGSLIVGTGCTAVGDTVTLTTHALAQGVRRILMLPPFYQNPVSDEGLVRSYTDVIDAVGSADWELYLYHIPRLSRVPITVEVAQILLDQNPDVLAGIKDSTGDVQQTSAFCAAFPTLRILPGTESLLLEGLALGAAGTITAGANINPSMLRRIYDDAQAPDAVRLQAVATSIRNVLQEHGTVPTIRALLAHYRDDPNWRRTRAPLAPSDIPDARPLAAQIEAAGYSWPGS